MPFAAVQQALEEIRNDRSNGASTLARRAARALREAALESSALPAHRFRDELCEAARALAGVRPAMTALKNTVALIVAQAFAQELPQDTVLLQKRIVEAADAILKSWTSAVDAISQFAADLLQGTVFTHSYSTTVINVLRNQRGQFQSVIVTESRPGNEGVKTARELASSGIPVTLITEAQAAHFLTQADLVLVGADTLLADGSLVNKSGTALLAAIAHLHQVPFYVVSERLKIAPDATWSDDLAEEKGPEEVLAEPLPGVVVRNLYFDRTPAAYISAIITEQGVLKPSDVDAAAREARDRLAALYA